MSFDAIKKNISVKRSARYFMSGPIDKNTKSVWVVVHGYAQHAQYFLQKFEPLFDAGHVFVAPEGLSRFYLRGSSGRVVASWMTSEDRLDEINDYVAYLDQVADDLQLPANIPLNVLGFSQGVATVSRWITLGNINPQRVILYAGVFPPDLDPVFTGKKWNNVRIDVFIGDKDEYYAVNDFRTAYEGLQKAGHAITLHEFEGGHEIIPAVLRNLME